MTHLSLFIELIPTGLMQSLMIACVAFGIMMTFRLLNFADLTAEGTFPLGGCLCALALIHGFNPFVATAFGMLAGGVVGFFTAYFHLKLRIHSLLSGIILATMLYSINLRILGKPNVALFAYSTFFSKFDDSLIAKIIILASIIALVTIALYTFLKTESGLRLRAVGQNPKMAQMQGIHVDYYLYIGLFIANALNALGGALMVQTQGYADVGVGIGIVIHALAALMIGEVIIGQKTLLRQILSPIIGAILYQQFQGLVLSLGMEPSDFKLMTGLVVLSCLSINLLPKLKRRLA
jgi:putative ABC transport system permease protein